MDIQGTYVQEQKGPFEADKTVAGFGCILKRYPYFYLTK